MTPTVPPIPAPVDYRLPSTEGRYAPVTRRTNLVGLLLLALPTLVATTLALANGRPLPNMGPLLIMGFLLLIFIAVPYQSAAQNRVYRGVVNAWAAHDYNWYRQAFPQCVDRRVAVCRHCGSRHLNVRNAMNRTFLRVHSCSRCGQTLYYSPEHS